jgi:hypothetical protein
VAALERRRVPLGHHRITATRAPAKAIVREARRIGAELIVMGQRAPRGRLHGCCGATTPAGGAPRGDRGQADHTTRHRRAAARTRGAVRTETSGERSGRWR